VRSSPDFSRNKIQQRDEFQQFLFQPEKSAQAIRVFRTSLASFNLQQ
jgi:hypothetical protein